MHPAPEPNHGKREIASSDTTHPLETTAHDELSRTINDAWKLPGGRYRIIDQIARGGMGVVFRAHDGSLDRPLAIKVMLTHPVGAELQERRFLTEATITGQLQHPGIPPVHEVGWLADGRPFFSMKLIEGRTLAELLRERAAPQRDLPSFLKMFEQIAQTLAYAHARRIIHRDLKPANIMVGAFGEVQVMDWGLAKRLAPVPAEAPATAPTPSATAPPDDTFLEAMAGAMVPDDSRTQAGQVIGTYTYMSPEQARGEVHSLDERCDVFGLGGILCVILTGQPPYADKKGPSLWQAAHDGDLRAAWFLLEGCGADRELVALAKACLAPRKLDRPRDAGHVAAAISRYLAGMQE